MSSFYGNASTGSGLPKVDSGDNGKVLIARNGDWELDFPSADGLPSVTEDDNGKVLIVNDGSWDIDYVDLGYNIVDGDLVTLIDDDITGSFFQDMYVQTIPNELLSSDDGPETIRVTIDNGESYIVTRQDFYGDPIYGEGGSEGPDFTNYPFCILNGNIYTQFPTYHLTIETLEKIAEVNDSFTLAVRTATGSGELNTSLQNLVDGNVSGSVRGINTASENNNYTIGIDAFAVGNNTKASGEYSHAEGASTIASGSAAHAEGGNTTASANAAHAEGGATIANGIAAHAEGGASVATGVNSHAEGTYTIATHLAQHVFGMYNKVDNSTANSNAKGNYVEIVGNGLSGDDRSNARTLDWYGNEILSGNLTINGGSLTLGNTTFTAQDLNSEGAALPSITANDNGKSLVVEDGEWVIDNIDLGYDVTITPPETTTVFNDDITGYAYGSSYLTYQLVPQQEFDERIRVTIDDAVYEVERQDTTYVSEYGDLTNYPFRITVNKSNSTFDIATEVENCHLKIENINGSESINVTDVSKEFTAAVNSIVTADWTAVEGDGGYIDHKPAIKRGYNSTTGQEVLTAIVEGDNNTASGEYSHAEGCQTQAQGWYSHAEGYGTTAANSSHTEGYLSQAGGQYSHAEGQHTIANHLAQHTFGSYNIEDPSTALGSYRGNYIEIVGNGTMHTRRSNARTLDWDGNEVLAGKLTVGVAPTNNMDVATKQYVDTAVNNAGGGSASSLPAVTTNDNGKSLVVEDGEWVIDNIDHGYSVDKIFNTIFDNDIIMEITTNNNEWDGLYYYYMDIPILEQPAFLYITVDNETEVALPYNSTEFCFGELVDDVPSFTNYPIMVIVYPGQGYELYTQENHQHLKIRTITKDINVTEDFSDSIDFIVEKPYYSSMWTELYYGDVSCSVAERDLLGNNIEDDSWDGIYFGQIHWDKNYDSIITIADINTEGPYRITLNTNESYELNAHYDENLHKYIYGTVDANGIPDFNECPFVAEAYWNESDGGYNFDFYTNQEEFTNLQLECALHTPNLKITHDFKNATILAMEGLYPINIMDGEQSGAIRSINAIAEDTNYRLGIGATALGHQTKASGNYSMAEGRQTVASNSYAHSEGYLTTASGSSAHAEGYNTTSTNSYSHAEGYNTSATGTTAHAEGNTTIASSSNSHAEGNNTTASGQSSHAEGDHTVASGEYSHAEGYGGANIALNIVSGAKGTADHSEGSCTVANSTTSGYAAAHAEGSLTQALAGGAHAEGYRTQATYIFSHAEGSYTVASGNSSHAEGASTTASGQSSHAEGNSTTASGDVSHAEGNYTTASGQSSHAEGNYTTASGYVSHAEGHSTIANHAYQHVFGSHNIADPSTASNTQRGTYIEIVGNGTADNVRSNARTLDWSGNEVLAGGLTVGAAGITIGSTTITEAQLQSLLALLN